MVCFVSVYIALPHHFWDISVRWKIVAFHNGVRRQQRGCWTYMVRSTLLKPVYTSNRGRNGEKLSSVMIPSEYTPARPFVRSIYHYRLATRPVKETFIRPSSHAMDRSDPQRPNTPADIAANVWTRVCQRYMITTTTTSLTRPLTVIPLTLHAEFRGENWKRSCFVKHFNFPPTLPT